MTSEEHQKGVEKRGFAAYAAAVAGWLICAAFCLWLTVELEAWPAAYDMFFPAVLLILFGNIFVFLFISSRWARQTSRLFSSVFRVCLGEAFLLAGMYILGRYFLGG